MIPRCLIVVLFFALFFVGGCGEPTTYPVRGRVVFPDGAPLSSGGVVLFKSQPREGSPLTARGEILKDGTFELTTLVEGDGARPGKHHAMVRADRDESDFMERGILPRPVIHPRFESFKTSPLEFEVQKQVNELTIVVERPS